MKFSSVISAFLVTLTTALNLYSAAPSLPANPNPAEKLFQAVERNDRAMIQAALDGGASIDSRDAKGNTALILAAMYSKPANLKLLLDWDADVNSTNRAGVSALIRSATDFTMVEMLLKAGAKANTRTLLGNTAMLLAARQYGSAPTLKLLFQHGGQINLTNNAGVTPLIAAAAANDTVAVRFLLQHGADIHAEPGPDFSLGGARTPLMWAAFRGNITMVKDLLDRGAKVDGSTTLGTPLVQAAWAGKVEVAKLLLDRGADVGFQKGMGGYTPLHWAASAEDGDATLTKLLLSRKADPNAEGGKEVSAFMGKVQTPLGLASARGSTPIVETLTKAGAHIGEQARLKEIAPPSREIPQVINDSILRESVRKAVRPLQRTTEDSRAAFLKHQSHQDCVSCHQQNLPMAAVGLVRRKGIPIDVEAARHQIDLLIHNGTVDRSGAYEDPSETLLQATFHPEPAFSMAYALFALDLEKQPACDATDMMVHHLAVIQGKDGQWYGNLPRPPIQSTDFAATALAIKGLKAFAPSAREQELNTRIARAAQWLAIQRPAFTEERTFQILGLAWANYESGKLASQAKTLILEQRADGGWAQLPGLKSDAYATGQALYALHEGAGIKTAHPAFQRGLRFLLQTQLDDGTWFVRRRAFPFQPTMDSGFPHGRDSWISASATSWAVMAMSFALDRSQAYRSPELRAQRLAAAALDPANAGVKGNLRVAPRKFSFDADIKPILEKSCLGCHGQKGAGGGYRVDTREGTLRAASSGETPVKAGRPDQSPLLRMVSDEMEDSEMPPVGKRDKYPALTQAQIIQLREWILQGAN